MTVTRHNPQGDVGIETLTSPGHRLREARLEAKVTVDEVAARLHLDPRLVEALENDQYAELPEATFVRGYLRGYAGLLGLPPAPIIESFDRHGFQAPELIPDIASKPQVQSSDASVRLATFVVVSVLFGLMIAWWWQTQETPIAIPGGPAPVAEMLPRTEEMTSPQSGQPDALPPEAELSPAPVAGQEPASEPEPVTVEPIDPVEPIEPASSVAVISTPPETLEAIPQPEPEVVEAEAVTEPDRTAVAAARMEEPVSPVEQTGSTGPSDRLTLRLKHDSWIEVYDREGERLYFGLAKGGTRITPTGAGPMRVLLGYARDAQVEYNGAFFDPAPYTRQDVARFTIGEPPAETN